MICGFVTLSGQAHPVPAKSAPQEWPAVPQAQGLGPTTSAVNRRRTVTYLPTATEAIVVDKHKVAEGTAQQSLIGKKPPQFREAGSPSSIRRHVADPQYPWSSGETQSPVHSGHITGTSKRTWEIH